jgi:CHAD domain-containing protein
MTRPTSTSQVRLLLPEPVEAESLVEILHPGIDVDPPATMRIGFLDTFDWRLMKAGGRLTREQGAGRSALHWQPPGDAPPYVLPFDGRIGFSEDLPQGYLRSELEPMLEVRRLLELGACRVQRSRARVVDDDGYTTVHLWLERSRALDEEDQPAADERSLLRVQGIPGHQVAMRRIVDLAREAGAVEVTALDEISYATEVRGRRPGDYSSKPKLKLRPKMRSDAALRSILLQLLDALEANVDGVIKDLDAEFLHDLRVASRRTRSALAQLKGVLAPDMCKSFADEFKWLGTVTGPLRDLDVYLIEMVTYREMLGDAAKNLSGLERLILQERRKALRRVRTGLRSDRFRRLTGDWREFLEEFVTEGSELPRAAIPVIELAGGRILKAYKRIVKRGERLGDDPPAEELHRLRIDAKKLRYLLEFFTSLYDSATISRLVKELKQLQDILGGFNDMEVQQARLEQYAGEMIKAGDADPATVLLMGRLSATLEERQEGFRHSFAGRFEIFAGAASRKRYAALLGGASR